MAVLAIYGPVLLVLLSPLAAILVTGPRRWALLGITLIANLINLIMVLVAAGFLATSAHLVVSGPATSGVAIMVVAVCLGMEPANGHP